ncbi:MAG: MATE family efflux transporter [Clostridiales bacterium]|nr:MATE family efflux transporter [Clostridiales bacterium]
MAQNKHERLLYDRPLKAIILFSLPIMASSLLQFMYNLVDNVVVGRYVGPEALAAVGVVSPINSFIIGTCMGLSSGFSIPVAQAFGASKSRQMNHYAGNSLSLCVLIGVGFAVFAEIFSTPLLRLIHTPDNVIDMASAYIGIIYLGIPVQMLYNNLTGIARAVGDSKTPLYFLAVSTVVNLGLDLLFVGRFAMGVEGAAIATLISQVISMVLAANYVLRRNKSLRIEKSDFRLQKQTCLHMLKIGVPLSLQFTVTSIGSMCLQGAVNSFGSNVVAGFTAAGKVENIANIPLSGLGVSTATFISQNFGAGNYAKIRKTVYRVLVLDIALSVFSSLFLLVTRDAVVPLFLTESNTAIRSAANSYLLAIAQCYSILSVLYVLRNSLQGLGTTYANAAAGAGELFGRIFVAYALKSVFGFSAVCYAGPVAWAFADVALVFIFVRKMRQLKEMEKKAALQAEKQGAAGQNEKDVLKIQR